MTALYQAARPHLGNRQMGFDYIFGHLDKCKNPLIVETGCARVNGDLGGDGQSSILFDNYICEHGGDFVTVDLDYKNTAFCRRATQSPRTTVITQDSVEYLKELNLHMEKANQWIDLLYLDSMDAPVDNPKVLEKSAEHHLKELLAIMPSVRHGGLIVVDDNWQVDGEWHGKGKAIYQWLGVVGIQPILMDYQFFWKRP